MSSAQPHAAQGVLLCAGRGSRLGGICKGRILVDGEALVVRQLRVMRQAGLGRVVVVLGHEAETIAAIVQSAAGALAPMEVVQVVLPQAEIADDIQVSVARGLRAISGSASGYLCMTLVDLPLLTAGHYQAILAHALYSGADIAMPQNSAGTPGHPLCIAADALAALPLMSEGFRLRDWIRGGGLRVRPLATEDPAHFTDLDTAEDARRLMSQTAIEIVIPQN